MASANLELVRSIYAAWERGDFSSSEWADPEIELVFGDGPTPGTWNGLAGMAEGMRDFLSAWEQYCVEAADEYRELDDARVLVLGRVSGRARRADWSSAQIRGGAGLFHVRGGKVTRYIHYFEGGRALTDLGLASETDSSRS